MRIEIKTASLEKAYLQVLWNGMLVYVMKIRFIKVHGTNNNSFVFGECNELAITLIHHNKSQFQDLDLWKMLYLHIKMQSTNY